MSRLFTEQFAFWIFFYTGREDKLSADNRAVVNNYQLELAQQISSLSNFAEKSLSSQKGHIQCVEKLCHTFLDAHEKVMYEYYQHFLILMRFNDFCITCVLIPIFSGFCGLEEES